MTYAVLPAVIAGFILLPRTGAGEETSGIFLRPVTVKPSLNLKYGYNSNVFRRSSRVLPGYSEPLTRVASGYLDVVPELGARMDVLNWLVLTNLRSHLTYYHNQEAEKQSTTSYPEFLGDHAVKWRSRGRSLSAEMGEKWKLTSEPIVQDIPPGLGGDRVKRFYNKFMSKASYSSRSGFLTVKTEYVWERNQYLQDLLSQMDYGVHNITVHGENSILPMTTSALAVRYRNARWDNIAFGRERDYDSVNVVALLNGQMTEKLSSTIALGYEFIFFGSGDFRSLPVALVKGRWKPRITMDVSAGFQRVVRPSISSRTYASNTFEVLGEFQGLRPRGLRLNIGFEFELDQYEGFNAKDVKLYSGHSGANYQLGDSLDWLRLGVEYGFELSRSDYIFYYYDMHRVQFMVHASY